MSTQKDQSAETPFDISRIPDRWQVVTDPRNLDNRALDLQYRGEEDNVLASITFEPDRIPETSVGEIIIEVQDKNAGEVSMGRLNPQAELLKFEDFDAAMEKVYELANEYPLSETRLPQHIEGVVIRSPNRPMPLSAKKEIRNEVTIIDTLDGGDKRRNNGFIATERPPEEILENYELKIDRSPDVVYRTDGRRVIEVYTNPAKIVKDGKPGSNLTPAEVVEKAEQLDHFTRIDGSPEKVLEDT